MVSVGPLAGRIPVFLAPQRYRRRRNVGRLRDSGFPRLSGIQHEARSALVWVALSGVVSLLLGLLILARWPTNSVYILGLLVGVDLIMAGTGWIAIGLGLRRGEASSRLPSSV
jgi:hypothetical protein